MFTDPEFARIGLNETEAKERAFPYRLANSRWHMLCAHEL
jgi:pyruvate/2-oxoglutarate dehydrogenase complex dihydrolipoamide dehydrogenase (E3) component